MEWAFMRSSTTMIWQNVYRVTTKQETKENIRLIVSWCNARNNSVDDTVEVVI